MDKNTLICILFIAAGLFSVVASVLNLDFFFNSRKAAFFLTIFGRMGARIFYTLLGTAIIVMGILLMTGVIVSKE